jgi:hypothetical protein
MPFHLTFFGSYSGSLSLQWSSRDLAMVLGLQTDIHLDRASVCSVRKRGYFSAVELLPR